MSASTSSAGLSRLSVWLDGALASQQGRLALWMPVYLGVGIGAYFLCGEEPSPPWLWLSGAAGLAGLLVALRIAHLGAALICAVAFVALGFALAGARAHAVATPVLDYRYYGPIEGRVVGLDRSGSGAIRVTLADVRLDRVPPQRTPTRVRLSLHGQGATAPPPGARIMTTGHLSAPNGPTEPGGFDFQRHTWFLQLGAVGYTGNPVLLADAAPAHAGVFGLRMALSRYVQDAVGGRAGGFAAAIATGDRAGLEPEVTQALRDTNLAHLLAISGLHMGLLTGFVFGALRLLFALLPPSLLGARLSGRKLAALGALGAGAVYLALSGGNVATERAFVMVAVALGAVLIDRRAISLRSVAVAAFIILVLRPEALLSPGFQMSFAATIALVVAFGFLTRSQVGQGRAWSKPLLALFVSASVAGLATLPFAAAHFNRMASYGLIANLFAPPVMGTVVVPSGVLAAILAPFGLDWIGFWIMKQGLGWIILVADTVASWPDPIRPIPAPPLAVLPLLSIGALWTVLVIGRARWLGLAPALVAGLLWALAERPKVLIAANGTLVGISTDEGARALSKAKGAGFVARTWLENDGEGLDQERAAALWPEGQGRLKVWPLETGGTLLHASGKRALAEVSTCGKDDLLITSTKLERSLPCRTFTPEDLRETGALALLDTSEGWAVISAKDVSGRRLWNDAQIRRANGY